MLSFLPFAVLFGLPVLLSLMLCLSCVCSRKFVVRSYQVQARLRLWINTFLVSSFTQKRLKRAFDPKLKILISMIQVLSGVIPAFSIAYPHAYLHLISNFAFWKSAVQPEMTACLFDVDFYHTFLFQIGLSFLVLLAVSVIWSLVNSQRWRLLAVQGAFQIALLYYPSVSSTIFQVFDCETFDDDSRYLKADVAIDCDTPWSVSMRQVAWVMAFIIPAGIPCAFWIAILHYWPQLSSVLRIEQVLREGMEGDGQGEPTHNKPFCPSTTQHEECELNQLRELERRGDYQHRLLKAIRGRLGDLVNEDDCPSLTYLSSGPCEKDMVNMAKVLRTVDELYYDSSLKSEESDQLTRLKWIRVQPNGVQQDAGRLKKLARKLCTICGEPCTCSEETQPPEHVQRKKTWLNDLMDSLKKVGITRGLYVMIGLQIDWLESRLDAIPEAKRYLSQPYVAGALRNLEESLSQDSVLSILKKEPSLYMPMESPSPPPTLRERAHAKLEEWHRFLGLELDAAQPACIIKHVWPCQWRHPWLTPVEEKRARAEYDKHRGDADATWAEVPPTNDGLRMGTSLFSPVIQASGTHMEYLLDSEKEWPCPGDHLVAVDGQAACRAVTVVGEKWDHSATYALLESSGTRRGRNSIHVEAAALKVGLRVTHKEHGKGKLTSVDRGLPAENDPHGSTIRVLHITFASGQVRKFKRASWYKLELDPTIEDVNHILEEDVNHILEQAKASWVSWVVKTDPELPDLPETPEASIRLGDAGVKGLAAIEEFREAFKKSRETEDGQKSSLDLDRAKHKLALYVHHLPHMAKHWTRLGLELRPDEVTVWLRCGKTGSHKFIKLHKGLVPQWSGWLHVFGCRIIRLFASFTHRATSGRLQGYWLPNRVLKWLSCIVCRMIPSPKSLCGAGPGALCMFASFTRTASRILHSSKQVLKSFSWGSLRRPLSAEGVDRVPPFVRNMTDEYQIRGPWLFDVDCGMPWEVVGCLHKVLLVGPFSLIVQGTALQLTLGITTSFLFLLLFGNHHALLRRGNNFLQQLAHLSISFSLLIGLVTMGDAASQQRAEANDIMINLACVEKMLMDNVASNAENATNLSMVHNTTNGSNATTSEGFRQCVRGSDWVGVSLIGLTVIPIGVAFLLICLEVWETGRGTVILPRPHVELLVRKLLAGVRRRWAAARCCGRDSSLSSNGQEKTIGTQEIDQEPRNAAKGQEQGNAAKVCCAPGHEERSHRENDYELDREGPGRQTFRPASSSKSKRHWKLIAALSRTVGLQKRASMNALGAPGHSHRSHREDDDEPVREGPGRAISQSKSKWKIVINARNKLLKLNKRPTASVKRSHSFPPRAPSKQQDAPMAQSTHVRRPLQRAKTCDMLPPPQRLPSYGFLGLPEIIYL